MVGVMCTCPIQKTRKVGNKYITDLIPCGHCSECVKKRQSGYLVRCLEEAKKRGNLWFVTLTYSDDHITLVDGLKSLNRADIKSWKHEVRRNYFRSTGQKFPEFSYLFAGEYGPRTHRPHYHGVIFGLDRKYIRLLDMYWKDHYGFTCFKPVKVVPENGHDHLGCVARYVAKYCVKPKDLQCYSDKVEKPRIQTSVGFGLPDDLDCKTDYWLNGHSPRDWIRDKNEIDLIRSRLHYEYNGFRYGFPIYLKRKILYEPNVKGNLVASPLQKVLSRSLRNDLAQDFDRKLRELVSGLSEREAIEAIAKLCDSEEIDFQSRENFGRKDLLNTYKKSKF